MRDVRGMQNAILLGCLIVLCYIAGYTVGEFSAYWEIADWRADLALREKRLQKLDDKKE